MSGDISNNLSAAPMMTAEAVMQQIKAKRDSHQERVEAAELAVNEALAEAKRSITEIENDLNDEEACFKLMRAANRVVCDRQCTHLYLVRLQL